jgi:hypothetical protein
MAAVSRRKGNKPNATGRNPTGRFVRLPFVLLESVAYRSLSPIARALLIELAMLDNGRNNGSIYLALRDAAARIGVADPHTAAAAFDELRERGFITMTRDAYFKVKAAEHSRARTWRLNWIPGPGRRVADWAFASSQPPAKSRANKRAERGCRALKAYKRASDAEKFPGVEFSHLELLSAEVEAQPVRKSRTASTENCGLAAHEVERISHTYTASHGVRGIGSTQKAAEAASHPIPTQPGWWQPDCSHDLARLAYAESLASHLGDAIANRSLAA